MRNCLRCGAEMQEGCTVKVEGAGYGVVQGKFFPLRPFCLSTDEQLEIKYLGGKNYRKESK